ncbi:MAG: hypothetical protein HGA31_06000 [Candidatus Moranbacteria bacterium]|nr:hypothetical protein [Candidatus Moranbacteria bacterium]
MWKLSELLLDRAGLRPLFVDYVEIRETAEETMKIIDLLECELAYALLPESIDISGNAEYSRARQYLSMERGVLASRTRDYRRTVKRMAGAFTPNHHELKLLRCDIESDRLVLARLVREIEYVFLMASGRPVIVGEASPAAPSRLVRSIMRLSDHLLKAIA